MLLDTHALLWLVRGEFRTKAAIAAVRAAQDEGRLYVSAVSAWELGVAELKRRDRPELGMPAARWFRQALALTGAWLATARVRRLPVVTRDGRMLALALSAPDYLEAVEC
ncbi:hypothetical protein RQ765_15285 [Roseomonas mucosa]|uniref:PIN domain-containing protein n=1 Tax=Roseomonas mucosa TaxID=207340 RepID=UPI0028CCF6D7|nr:PIN domain-containing protein [Roseomonas mucosa]MDT8315443.1 hypothetical protein [Roseomonas mucosa]MDT8361704.1 hypothetical protein [Roseomonas mucosa]